jgi:hypothetical protein
MVTDDPDKVLEHVLAFYEERGAPTEVPAKSDDDRMFYL